MDAVRAAIEGASAFVFVIGPGSAESEVCLHEVEHAVKVRKRILPVVHDDVDPKALPEAVATRNWIFMRPGDDLEAALDALQTALDTDPEWAAMHTRLLVRASEWDHNRRDGSFALRGRDLASAEKWLTAADERKDPQPSRLQTEYIFTSRQAATQSQRIRMTALGVGLVIALTLAVYALIQRHQADQRARDAHSKELAARALGLRNTNPEAGLLLAVEAARTSETAEAERAIRQTIAGSDARGVLSQHADAVNSAVFSPDGRLAATASDDGGAWIWDVAGERTTHRLDPGPGRATAVAFSPDGRRLLTATSRGAVKLWRVGSGEHLHSFQGLAGDVESVAFSPAGNLVVAGGDHGARVWRMSGSSVSRFAEGPGTVNGVDIDRGGRRVVTASTDGSARVWSAADGHLERTLMVDGQPGVERGTNVESARFSPRDDAVLTASDDGAARIWSLRARRAEVVLPASTDLTKDASFSPDGSRVVTASLDGQARVWDPGQLRERPYAHPRRGQLLSSYPAPSGQILGASFGPDGRTVLTAEGSGLARIWKPPPKDVVLAFPRPSGNSVLGGGFSPDGERIVTSTAYDGGATIWDAHSGVELGALPGVQGRDAWSAEFSPDGSRVVSGLSNGTAEVWNAKSRAPLRTLNAQQGIVYSATFSPDGRRVATAGSDGTVKLWDTAHRSRPLTIKTGGRFENDVNDVAFSLDGRTLVEVGESRIARLWDASTRRPLGVLRGHTDTLNSAAVSPDGETVLTTSEDKTARTWDLVSGRSLEVFRGHSQAVLSAAFSPNGEQIATGSADFRIGVWDTESGQLLDMLHGPTDWVTSVAFSPDGKSILAASYDGEAYVLRCRICIPIDRLERIARHRVEEALTPAERRQYLSEAGVSAP